MRNQSKGFFVEHPLGHLLHSEPSAVIGLICPHCDGNVSEKQWFRGPVKEVLEQYREHVLDNHSDALEDCGSCGCQHFPEFDGDCREDWERF